MSYRICTSCGASDGQGCYSTCPTMLQARVAELEAEVAWHKDASARRGEAEAAVLRHVQELEDGLRQITCLRAENERRRVALESVMIGGNSLAQIIGADHPPHGTPYGEALTHYGSGVKYEAWCCWNAIMLARAALEGK